MSGSGFTFIVEDGTMVANSNSYTTVAYCDTYLMANSFMYPLWQALDLLQQQLVLVWASRYIDQRATWNGRMRSEAMQFGDETNLVATWASPPEFSPVPQQSMRWPRVNVRDIDGNVIAYDTIPYQLQDAVCEMARYLFQYDRSLERPQDFLTELKAGDVTLKFRDAVLAIVPSEVSYIIRGLGTVASGRTNFSKIRKV